MRLASVVVLIALAARGVDARAQSAPRSHFNRTTSGGDEGRTASPSGSRRASAAVERTTSRLGADLLAPYTSTPRGGAASTRAATAPPPRRPVPAPVSRNYFPSGRSGQVRHHCTPSRAGVYGNRR